MQNKKEVWQSCHPLVFWGEIAPTEHLVQIYENDEVFLDLLEDFIKHGVDGNECVVIIATANHTAALKERLLLHSFDVDTLCHDDHLIMLDAHETLSKFMVNNWPDDILFQQTISSVIKRGHDKSRKVRAFGEMAALLWAQGLSGATVQLENLWDRFCETEAFCLFCAYPKSGFTQDINSSINSIFCMHSKVISGDYKSRKEIFYRNI